MGDPEAAQDDGVEVGRHGQVGEREVRGARETWDV